MKSLVALSLVFLALPARADGPAYVPQVEVDEQVDTARVERVSGAVLTVVGGVMAIGSAFMAGAALSHGLPIDCDGGPCDNAPLFDAGVGLAVTSSVLMSVGIPLWVSGSDKLKTLARRTRIGGFFGKNAGGASVRVSF